MRRCPMLIHFFAHLYFVGIVLILLGALLVKAINDVWASEVFLGSYFICKAPFDVHNWINKGDNDILSMMSFGLTEISHD